MTEQGSSGVLRRWQQRLTGKSKAKSAAEALLGSGIPIIRVPKATGRGGTRRRGAS